MLENYFYLVAIIRLRRTPKASSLTSNLRIPISIDNLRLEIL